MSLLVVQVYIYKLKVKEFQNLFGPRDFIKGCCRKSSWLDSWRNIKCCRSSKTNHMINGTMHVAAIKNPMHVRLRSYKSIHCCFILTWFILWRIYSHYPIDLALQLLYYLFFCCPLIRFASISGSQQVNVWTSNGWHLNV